MIVQASRVGLAAQSSVSLTRERTETTRAWVGERRPDFEGATGEGRTVQGDRLEVSQQARAALEARRAHASAPLPDPNDAAEGLGTDAKTDEIELSPQDELKMRLIEDLLSQVLGREVKLSRLRGTDGQSEVATAGQGVEDASGAAPNQAASQTPQRVGWGFEATIEERSVRQERMSFAAAGQVRTADGKDISFALELDLERVEVQESRLEIRLGDAVRKDPLVLNFAGNAAELTERAFAFDLDADGQTDSVHLATGGSAFLARDPGEGPFDGRILFGPATGDGFAELAALDADTNGWIDEADPAWKDLRLWSRDEGGQDSLRTLQEAGVGALHLGSVATPWELDGGAVARTGVWLGEPGTTTPAAGTLQHVDLYV